MTNESYDDLIKQIEALEGRIEACARLLDQFRQRLDIDGNKSVQEFGEEYDWVEYADDIHKEYAPEYASISAAYIKDIDGCVDEVWVTTENAYHGNGTRYERVY